MLRLVVLLSLVPGAACATLVALLGSGPSSTAANTAAPLVPMPQGAVAAGGSDDASGRGGALHPVQVHRPDGPPRVETDRTDALGRPVTVTCSSCHSTRDPDPSARSADVLDEFHDGLTYVHGDLSCLACHDADDYDRLRLAEGTPLPFEEVMDLCAQCHGHRARDYAHGAHGGMSGHWDLARGPRARNTCTDCHDPHAPAFPRMRPTFKPRDRFLEPPEPEHAHD